MTDIVGLPLTSMLLFLIAGILIGYLCWYPDRALQRAKIENLESRYWKARGAGRQWKARYRQIQHASETQKTDLDQLQNEHESLWVKYVNADNDLAKTRRELATLRNEKQPIDDELVAEKHRSETVVRQLREVLESKTKLEQRERQQALAISHLESLVAALKQSAEQPQAGLNVQVEVIPEHRDTTDYLGQDSTVATHPIEAEIAAADKIELQMKLQDIVNKLQRTQQDLAARCADLDFVRDERDALDQQVKQAEQQSRHYRDELARVGQLTGNPNGITNQRSC